MTLHSSGSEDFWVERRMVARVLKRVNRAWISGSDAVWEWSQYHHAVAGGFMDWQCGCRNQKRA